MKALPPPLLSILADWPQWQLCQVQPRAEQITAMPAGLTNTGYLLQLESGCYVLRIASTHTDKLAINRDAEFAVQQSLAQLGLTPQVRYKAPDNRYWIRDYLTGRSLTIADLTLPNLKVMLQTLKTVHQLPTPKAVPQLSIEEKAEHYWRMIEQNYSANILAFYAPLQQKLSGLPAGALSLCHMDPTAANWIQTTNDRLVLLDWEYAAIGHPWWDVAALLQQTEITTTEEKELLQTYGIDQNEHWLLAQAQMHYMTVLWYGAQGYWAEEKLNKHLQDLAKR